MVKKIGAVLLVSLTLNSFAQEKTNYKEWAYTTCDSLYKLLERDSAITAVDRYRRTHIHDFTAITSPCSGRAIEILVARGVDINAKDIDSNTALDIAVQQKDVEKIVGLRQRNAEMYTTSRSNKFYHAICVYDYESVRRIGRKEYQVEGFTRALDWNTIYIGPRINYMPHRYGFIGFSCPVLFQNVEYLPNSHFGISVGADIRPANNFLMAPKISAEYRYQLIIARAGYLYYTDFEQHTNAAFGEIGISLLSYLDLTYLHVFPQRNEPFGLIHDYLNLTLTIGLPAYTRK